MKGNKLGEIIINLRKEKNMTQKDLAESLNVSNKAISRWETSKSSPSLEMIYEISKFFNVSFKSLLEARVNDNADNELVQEIIHEFTEINSKNAKRIKVTLFVTFIVIIGLVITIIFTNTFNRFKVYKVNIESSDFKVTSGVYVETNIKDTLYLNDISVKGLDIKETDTISLDLYFVENGKENILYTFSKLNNIQIDNYQSYIKFDDLSDYFDNLYLRLSIIDEKNEIKTYNAKLEFVLDFSNNVLYHEQDVEKTIRNGSAKKTSEEIKSILLANGFEQDGDDILVKKLKNSTIHYYFNFDKISYRYETKKLNYKYTYDLNDNILDVYVYNTNNLVIENYKYDVLKDEIIECVTGSCNDYKEAMKTLNEKVLYLLEE